MMIFLLVVTSAIDVNYLPKRMTPPSPRILPVMDYSPVSNSLYVFGGYANGLYLNDFWTFSLDYNTWTKYMPLGTEFPASRSAIGGFASNSDQKFYFFGGISSTGIFNDFWEFDVTSQSWNEIETVDPPSSRHSFAFLKVLEDHLFFYVFGGRTMDGVDNNLFRLNLTSLEWTQFPLNGEVPRLYSCNIQKYENFIYLVGGAENYHFNRTFGGMYRYDLDKFQWENVYQNDFDQNISRNTYERRDLAGSLLRGSILYLAVGMSSVQNKNLPDIMMVNLSDPEFNWDYYLERLPTGEGIDSFAYTQVGSKFFGFGGFIGSSKILTNSLLSLDTSKENVLEGISSDSPPYSAPQSRSFHSMSLVNGKFYVFGGVDGNDYFNDIWIYDPISGENDGWTTINTIGTIPSGRYAFAYDSEGDAIAIWGGQDFIGLNNDFYIFKIFSSTWERFDPVSLDIPTAAKGACLSLKIPNVYIYGGETNSGLTNSFYSFNILTNKYEKLVGDNYVAYATCELIDMNTNCGWYNAETCQWGNINSTCVWNNITDICESNDESKSYFYFYVIFGRTKNTLVNRNVRKYYSYSGEWSDHLTVDKENNNLTTQGVTLFINGDIIVIGGQLWDVYPYRNVYYYTQEDNSQYSTYKFLGEIKEYPYRAAFTYYQASLYIFGGSEVIGNSIRSGVSMNRMYSISLKEICGNNCNYSCSKGTNQTDTTCSVCPKGTYSVGISNSSCDECPLGTYNPFIGSTSPRQCYPCAENTYNKYTGKGFCVDCLNGYSCPPGSVEPVDLLITSESGSIQPQLFKRPDISDKIFTFQISIGLILSFFFLVVISFKKLRKFLKRLDTFTNLHNYVIGEVMLLRATFLGGAATLLFLCIAIVIVGTTFINYEGDNIRESKTLVPKVVLDQEVKEFTADIKLIVEFMRYGDSCSNIDYKKKNINSKDFFKFDKNDDEKTCRLELDFLESTVNSGATVTFTSNEPFSYCSGITVNMTSTSSIPGEISSILTTLSPDSTKVFVGPIASEFYFTTTPSLYKSDEKKQDKRTGYHISSEFMPKAGSQFITSELSIITQLRLVIVLTLSNSGLYTYRYYEQTFVYVASALIGSIFGIMGAVGGVMKFIEKNYWRVKKVYKKKCQLDAVDSKRNWVEKQFESQVDGREEDREDLGKSFRLDIDY